ncbi:MAG: NlpC/P60 family protein [Nitriliruptorales bacterium]
MRMCEIRRVTRRGARVIAACVVVLLMTPAVAGAQPADVRSARQRLETARRNASEAEQRLGQIEREAGVAVERYNEAREGLEALRRQVSDRESEIRGLEREMDTREQTVGDLARHLYVHGGGLQLEALLGSGNPSDLQTRASFLRSAAQAQVNAVTELANSRRVMAARLTELEESEQAATSAAQQLAAERDAVERTLAGQAEEVARLEAEVGEAQQGSAAAERAEAQRIARDSAQRVASALAAERAARQGDAASNRASVAAHGTKRPGGPAPSAVPASGRGRKAVDAALSQLGKPYKWGGSGPDSYDCSGLTMWAWRHAGVSLPHSSRMQYQATRRISRADLQPGDLVFFGDPIHHEAMYIGDGKVVEAPYSGSQVRINSRALSRRDIAGYGRPAS